MIITSGLDGAMPHLLKKNVSVKMHWPFYQSLQEEGIKTKYKSFQLRVGWKATVDKVRGKTASIFYLECKYFMCFLVCPSVCLYFLSNQSALTVSYISNEETLL